MLSRYLVFHNFFISKMCHYNRYITQIALIHLFEREHNLIRHDIHLPHLHIFKIPIS